MVRDRLCFDDNLNVVTYCIDDSDFQIIFDSLEEKDRILSVMKTLKILNHSKTVPFKIFNGNNKSNIEFITKTVIEKLCETNIHDQIPTITRFKLRKRKEK